MNESTQPFPSQEVQPDHAGEQKKSGLSRRNLLRGFSIASVPMAALQLTGCGGANAAEPQPSTTPTATLVQTVVPPTTSAVTITRSPYVVAMIHKIASTTFNLSAGIDSLIGFMQEAKTHGASLVVAGEMYLPGYDPDINYTSDWAVRMWPTIKANSIVVGDANWLRILNAARTIGIAVSFGFSEKADRYYYMAQALIGDDGVVWNKRRKVRPSGAERDYWSDDVMTGNLVVTTTPLGRIGMLECWDHLRPQSTFNVMSQLPNVHVCAWPYTNVKTATTPFWDKPEVAHTGASYFSQLTGAYTLLVSVGFCAVYRWSEKLAEITPSDPASMLYYTITPSDWSGATGSPTSEFSWGVLQLLNENYPGQKTADTEHGVIKLNAS